MEVWMYEIEHKLTALDNINHLFQFHYNTSIASY